MCGNCDIVDSAREQKIAELEAACAKFNPQFMDVTHTIAGGVYTRTGRVKAGEIIIGTKHKARSIFHLARGRVAVLDNVHGCRILTAPFSEVTQPGMQRIGIALEDFEGSNIFETDKTTVDEIEREMLFPFVLPLAVGRKILEITDLIQA